jgi:hypothetical protein
VTDLADAAFTRYRGHLAYAKARTAAAVAVVWDRLGSWRDEDVARFEQAAAPVFEAGKQTAVALTAAFVAVVLEVPPPAVPAAAVVVPVDLREPFTAAWHALSMDRPWPEALAAGRSVAAAVGGDFVQSTARRTGDVVARTANRQVRWRRVTDANPCDWCRSAAKVYRSAESADIGHSRCGCDVFPVAA